MTQEKSTKLTAGEKFKDVTKPFARLWQLRILHNIKYQPELLNMPDLPQRPGLNIDPNQLHPRIEVFISTTISSKQRLELENFEDCSKLGVRSWFGFNKKVLQHLHRQESQLITNWMKFSATHLKDQDFNNFVYGMKETPKQILINNDHPFIPNKLDVNYLKGNEKDFLTYVKNYNQVLKQEQYRSVRYKLNGSIIKCDRKREYVKTSIDQQKEAGGILIGHYWELLLSGKIKNYDGTTRQLKDRQYVQTLLLSGTGESEHLMYKILVQDIKSKPKPNSDQYCPLFQYLYEKFYNPNNGRSQEENQKLRRQFQDQQRFIRNVFRMNPITLQKKLQFQGSHYSQEVLEQFKRIDQQNLVEQLDKQLFKKQIQLILEQQKNQKNQILSHSMQINSDSQQIDSNSMKKTKKDKNKGPKSYEEKAKQFLQDNLKPCPWKQKKSTQKKPYPTSPQSRLSYLNRLLFCWINNVPGSVQQDQNGKWKIMKKLDQYVPMQPQNLEEKIQMSNDQILEKIEFLDDEEIQIIYQQKLIRLQNYDDYLSRNLNEDQFDLVDTDLLVSHRDFFGTRQNTIKMNVYFCLEDSINQSKMFGESNWKRHRSKPDEDEENPQCICLKPDEENPQCICLKESRKGRKKVNKGREIVGYEELRKAMIRKQMSLCLRRRIFMA